jgi:hypothetical protein
VRQWWLPYNLQGYPSFILQCSCFENWLEEMEWEGVFGNVEKQKKSLLEELRGLDVLEEERTLSNVENFRKAEIISYLGGLL